jgi:NDP-sugar pyrophosphorylase family protein
LELVRAVSCCSIRAATLNCKRRWRTKDFRRSPSASISKARRFLFETDYPCAILAGGLGTRMQSSVPNLPKSLIPVLGRPFIEWQLEWLAAQGIREVILCIGHQGAMIRRHVGTGTSFGLRVTYVDEGDALKGTAGALRLAVDEVGIATPFYALYGDSFLDVSVADVTSTYLDVGLPALMTVFRNDRQWEESNATFDGKKVTRYEKLLATPPPDMVYVDYGFLIFDTPVIDEFIPDGEVIDLADVLGRLSTNGRLAGFEASQRFFEIGSPRGLIALEEHLTSIRDLP